ncbi:hypothetical protein KIW84_022704 [Lathyrus oleraceus]|uniref:Uncharacterized protein n=1 Tax=Pisum sativum TaxID=3888 RepID=A0A9D5BB16_PEA|nr:hypothetical protein KIW84_022704 [Pisum sativum]
MSSFHSQGGRGGRGNFIQCQVRKKYGHDASICYHGFKKDYVPSIPLDDLSIIGPQRHAPYSSMFQTGMASLMMPQMTPIPLHKCTPIPLFYFRLTTHPTLTLTLHNLLHVPTITKTYQVSQFAKDNKVFFEFHSDKCLVKSQATEEVLFLGKLGTNGLYMFLNPVTQSSAPTIIIMNVFPSGYWYLAPNGRIDISKDVIFNEHHSPYPNFYKPSPSNQYQ